MTPADPRPDPVTYDCADGIAVITLNHPPVNALSAAVREGLAGAMARFAADDRARIAVLVGAGRGLSAGADVTEFGRPPSGPALPELIDRVEALEKPVVAVLHGTTLGGGLELALGAHYRVALSSAQMGLPEVTLGLLPGAGGTQRLPRLVGFDAAADIITSARRVAAPEALALGLIDEIGAEDNPRAAGIAAAGRLLAQAQGITGNGSPGAPRRVRDLPAPVVEASVVARLRDDLGRRHGGEIARQAALDAIAQGAALPFDAGQAQERAAFRQLLDSPQRAALIHAFLAERRAGTAPHLDGIAPRPVARLGVVGGGTMGAGIAATALLAGLDVTLTERDTAAAARAADSVADVLDGALRRGKLDEAGRDRILGEQFRATDDRAVLASVDLVIEAVFEKLEVKDEVFAALDAICRPGTILATNTSYLDVARIAAATARPADVIGLHFFSPAHVMRLLEIVVPASTAPDVVATALALARRLGKVPVLWGSCDGFIGNRMMNSYRRAADAMVLDGASPYQIDRALRDFGFAMGPYQVSDLAGLDIGYFNRQRNAATRDPRERVPVFADRLVEAGHLGRKSGRGYYLYDDASPRGRPDRDMDGFLAAIRAELGLTPRAFDDEEIRNRYLAAMINEAARILGEGVAQRPSDVDVVKLCGYGFPRWRGGPMHHADQDGAAAWLDRIRTLAAAEDAYFWQPAPLLGALAAAGGSFAALNDTPGAAAALAAAAVAPVPEPSATSEVSP